MTSPTPDDSHHLEIWHVENIPHKTFTYSPDNNELIKKFSLNPDGSTVIIETQNCQTHEDSVAVYSTTEHKRLFDLNDNMTQKAPRNVDYSPDGTMICGMAYSADWEKAATNIWDSHNGKLLYSLLQNIPAIAYSGESSLQWAPYKNILCFSMWYRNDLGDKKLKTLFSIIKFNHLRVPAIHKLELEGMHLKNNSSYDQFNGRSMFVAMKKLNDKNSRLIEHNIVKIDLENESSDLAVGTLAPYVSGFVEDNAIHSLYVDPHNNLQIQRANGTHEYWNERSLSELFQAKQRTITDTTQQK